MSLTLLTIVGCAGRTAAPFEQGEARYRFDLALERARGETGSCTARVAVTDLRSRRAIVIPPFSARWGTRTQASAADSIYGARLEVDVTVAPDGASGSCRAVLRRDERLLASREARVPVTVTTTTPQIRY